MLKRVLAWIALIFLLLIITNILFIHVYVTESVTIFHLVARPFALYQDYQGKLSLK
jgi:hypothetical protein